MVFQSSLQIGRFAYLAGVGDQRKAQSVSAALLDAVRKVGLLRSPRPLQLLRVQVARLRMHIRMLGSRMIHLIHLNMLNQSCQCC